MTASNPPTYRPMVELTLARLREFYREPAAVFWVYGFPLLIALALGIAFRDRPVERIQIDVVAGPYAEVVVERLKLDPRLVLYVPPSEAEWRSRLRSGKTDLVIIADERILRTVPEYDFWVEPNRPESILARNAVENALLRRSLGESAPQPREFTLQEVGGRYIDFLIPGLIGMNVMGGGLWGVGFVIVDMRVRKLLKRFLATPMRRSDFLMSVMLSRMIFTVPEVLILLGFGWWIFEVRVAGSLFDLIMVILLGATSFSGIGLMVACRAKTIETVSGLMNLVMLPMYVLSGVFFSSERFPPEIQPLIQLLPLTALNDALRAVMLDGKGLFALGSQFAVLAVWAIVSFAVALRFFRWK